MGAGGGRVLNSDQRLQDEQGAVAGDGGGIFRLLTDIDMIYDHCKCWAGS